MAYPGDFKKWLQEELTKREWSLSDLSKRSGISQPHISNILSGNRKPGADSLGALARALNLPPDLVFRKGGLLPPTKEELNDLEREWEHLFDQAVTDEERRELIQRAQYELTRLRERRGGYKA